MGYGAHMVTTGLIVGASFTMFNSYSASSTAAQAAKDKEELPKLKKVDPDLFNPFTPIPFHNNIELKYRYANMRLHGYLDAKTHLNVKDYAYKGFHDAFDHSSKKQHYYNWINVVPSHNS